MRVVNQGVRGDIAADVAVVGLAVLFGEIEDLGERPAIQIVFELGSAVLGVGRGVRRLPVLFVIRLPFALEVFLPTAAGPEFRFFEMDGLRAGIQRALDSYSEIFPVILPGRDIRNVAVAAMQDRFAIGLHLGLIPVVLTVELAVEIVLILTPGYARHHVDGVSVLPPGFDVAGHARPYAVHHGHIRIEVGAWGPRSAGLKTQALFSCALDGGCVQESRAGYQQRGNDDPFGTRGTGCDHRRIPESSQISRIGHFTAHWHRSCRESRLPTLSEA